MKNNIFDLTTAKKKLSRFRQNKTVVLTGGVFDLFHIGHLNYLKKVSKMGDLLVVHVDDDVKVKEMKGSFRPVVIGDQRAQIINCLKFVDLVILSNKVFYSEEILKAVKPDVIAKVVRKNNVSLMSKDRRAKIKQILPDVKIKYVNETVGVSTSKIINGISGAFIKIDKKDKLVSQLFKCARSVSQNGISFSGLQVGAALYANNGKIYTGSNLSNSSPALALCAERVAIAKAVSDGATSIKMIFIYSPNKSITPCGLCRQSIIELGNPPELTEVYVANDTEILKSNITSLLPEAFVTPRKNI